VSESHSADPQLATVREWLLKPGRSDLIGNAIRLAFDWVIDGPRTGRFSTDQLETSEKIYIGNRVEHELLHQLDLQKKPPLDTEILRIPVDVKFSMTARRDWMIPPEAVDQLCLMVTANDEDSLFSAGLFRAKPIWLGRPNRDGKHSILKVGRDRIVWICEDAPLPENFLLHLPDDVRQHILSLPSGRARVIEAFRVVQNRPISTYAIDTLAVQRDPSKRIRDARKELAPEGIAIYGDRYDKAKVAAQGLPPLKKDMWIAVRVDSPGT
jgi:hypothetical protein